MIANLRTTLLGATLLGGLAATGALAAPAAPQLSVTVTHAAEATRLVNFDVVLPLHDKDKMETLLTALHDEKSPLYHKWLTPQEFGRRFGPSAASIERVAAALRAKGFTVEPHTRSLHVHGTAGQVSAMFGAKLMMAKMGDNHEHAITTDTLQMPKELADEGAQIFSFIPHSMHTNSQRIGAVNPANRYSATGTYWYDDLKQAYSYPAYGTTAKVGKNTVKLDGTGASVGILMSSDVYLTDIAAVFDHEGFSTTTGVADPTVSIFDIDGGGGLDGGALDEASLDTQEVITGAPGANVILYSIPSLSDGDIFNGYVTIDESNAVDMVTSSFGGCELGYSPAYNGGQSYYGVLEAYHELFQQGNIQGISFLASSGDEAGLECPSLSYFTKKSGKYIPSVGEPASDPSVTGVGGTNVVTGYVKGSLTSPYVGENAWSDPWDQTNPYGIPGDYVKGSTWGAGGGYSALWTQPGYQAAVNTGSTKARAVPDVGMQVGGCPSGATDYNPNVGYCNGGPNKINGDHNNQRSAVVVAINGGFYGLIGTSVASPELAGAMAPLIALQGRQGNFNVFLYKQAAAQAAGGTPVFHTNIPGYNGVVLTDLNSAYSLSVGVGTPIVASLLGLPTIATAGDPQTASNP